MLSSNDQKLEKLDSFYRPPVSKQRTSAEIISEARNALRTVRTQRPFTPREDQRKLFGPASSRSPENRPPSSFSLHASSFELSDSKPISGTRLRPLELDLLELPESVLHYINVIKNKSKTAEELILQDVEDTDIFSDYKKVVSVCYMCMQFP